MTIVRHDNQTTTDAEIVGAFLAQGGAPARVMDAWKRVIMSGRFAQFTLAGSLLYG